MKTILKILTVIALSALVYSCMSPKENKITFYIGSYAEASSSGIYLYDLDLKTKTFTEKFTAKGIKNPSFLALSPKQDYLYAVSESSSYDSLGSGGVFSFAVSPETGELKVQNSVSSGGASPCHISVHPSGKWVFAANYTGGNVISIPINPDGRLNPDSQSIQHLGSGPNKARQDKAHAHSAKISPDGRFLLVGDLGLDKVMGYGINPSNGRLSPHENATFSTSPGAGPRHIAFSPKGDFVFIINELNSTLSSCSFHSETGGIKEIETVSTLDKDPGLDNYCADIHVHPNGKYLYASNRGANTIVVFNIATDGTLEMIQTKSCGGDWPRNFTITDTGDYLLVANQRSDNVVVYALDQKSGVLGELVGELNVKAPVCLVLRN